MTLAEPETGLFRGQVVSGFAPRHSPSGTVIRTDDLAGPARPPNVAVYGY